MQGQEEDNNQFGYDTFIRVTTRKKRKGKHKDLAATASELLTRVKEELLTADGGWWQSCDEIFHEALRSARIKPQKVLCLGLGSPSLSRDARTQLALLSHLCGSAQIASADVWVYDPVFTGADAVLFQTLGMRCLDHIQGAEHALDCPTLLYMPHCDLKLYESVVRANWSLDGLSRILFLSNSFGDYVDNNVGCKLEKESPCLMKLGTLVPFLECRRLPTSTAFPSAFNNLAVQYVNTTLLSLQTLGRPRLDFSTPQRVKEEKKKSRIQNQLAYQQAAITADVDYMGDIKHH